MVSKARVRADSLQNHRVSGTVEYGLFPPELCSEQQKNMTTIAMISNRARRSRPESDHVGREKDVARNVFNRGLPTDGA
jgi:hypothetical protein